MYYIYSMITEEDILDLGFKIKYKENTWVMFENGDLEISHQFKKVSPEYPNPINFRGKYHTNFRLKLETKEELKDILNKLR